MTLQPDFCDLDVSVKAFLQLYIVSVFLLAAMTALPIAADGLLTETSANERRWAEIIRKPLFDRAQVLRLGHNQTARISEAILRMRERHCDMNEPDRINFIHELNRKKKLKAVFWFRYRKGIEEILRKHQREAGIRSENAELFGMLETMVRLAIERDEKRIRAVHCDGSFDRAHEAAFYESVARFFSSVALNSRVEIANKFH